MYLSTPKVRQKRRQEHIAKAILACTCNGEGGVKWPAGNPMSTTVTGPIALDSRRLPFQSEQHSRPLIIQFLGSKPPFSRRPRRFRAR